MKLTNGDVFQAREPLQKLMTAKLPVKTAYSLAKLARKLSEQFDIIEEVRKGLVHKHGEKDQRGSASVKPGSPQWDKFVEEFNELLGQEVTLVVEKVQLPETFDIEPSVLFALEKFIYV